MERPDQVLDAAATCIARVGLAKTTLDDVAREARCARATVYRYFTSKLQLQIALVTREVERLQGQILGAAADAPTLGDAVTAVITTGARSLQSHAALAFVAAYEPELLLPYLAFEREDAVLRGAAVLIAPAFEPFLDSEASARLGEWVARLTLSYLCCPSDHIGIGDPEDVKTLVESFVLPGFVNTQGVSR